MSAGVAYYVRRNTGRSLPSGGIDFRTPQTVIVPSKSQASNDNWRPPRPANDNVAPPAWRIPQTGGLARFSASLRLATRLVPYINWVITGYDLFRWWQSQQVEPQLADPLDGWTFHCGGPNGTPYAQATFCGSPHAAFIGDWYSKVGRTSFTDVPGFEVVSFKANQRQTEDLVNTYMVFDTVGYASRPLGVGNPALIEIPVPVLSPQISYRHVPYWINQPVFENLPQWSFDRVPWHLQPERPNDLSSDGTSRGYRYPQHWPENPPDFLPPVITVDLDPTGRVDLSTRPGRPRPPVLLPKPPPSPAPRPVVRETRPNRAREVKVRGVSTAGEFVRVSFDTLTELDDLLDAFYKAIPKNLRTLTPDMRKQLDAVRLNKGWKPGMRKVQPPIQQKLVDVIKNWDTIDHDKAIENMVTNEIGDRVFGRVGKALGSHAKAHGRPVGYGMGPVF